MYYFVNVNINVFVAKRGVEEMKRRLLKIIQNLLLSSLFLIPFLNGSVANAQERVEQNMTKEELNQMNIEKVKAASGIDYILLPNGEKVYAETASYTVYDNGTYTFAVFDKVGNSEIIDVEVNNIDKINPRISLNQTQENGYTLIDVVASDDESGVSHIILPGGQRVDGSSANFKALSDGEYVFQVYDVAGNSTTETVNVTNTGGDITKPLKRESATSNLDVYIKSENMISLSLNTNSVLFNDFSGVGDSEKNQGITLTVSSSLPYSISASLAGEIQSNDKASIMNKDILNIKESSQNDYKTFVNTSDKILLKGSNTAGNSKSHGIDLKLKGGIAHDKAVYKTAIKIEVTQD